MHGWNGWSEWFVQILADILGTVFNSRQSGIVSEYTNNRMFFAFVTRRCIPADDLNITWLWRQKLRGHSEILIGLSLHQQKFCARSSSHNHRPYWLQPKTSLSFNSTRWFKVPVSPLQFATTNAQYTLTERKIYAVNLLRGCQLTLRRRHQYKQISSLR